jgi:hypothetical protein
MKLSDVVSALKLPIFAELPLVIFFVIFVMVFFHVWRRGEKYEAARLLPLDSSELPPNKDDRS